MTETTWITIESAPLDGTPVDLYVLSLGGVHKTGRITDCEYDMLSEKWWMNGLAQYLPANLIPTHFMYIPLTPEVT